MYSISLVSGRFDLHPNTKIMGVGARKSFFDALSTVRQVKNGNVQFFYHNFILSIINFCRGVLNARWFGPRITFGFTQCPICKVKCFTKLN